MLNVKNPSHVGAALIRYLVNESLQTHSGQRKKLGYDPVKKRRTEKSPTMLTHGFRKFFNTACNTPGLGMSYVLKEKLMGHEVGLDYHYDRSDEQTLLQEYLKVHDLVTIEESNRLQLENTELKEQVLTKEQMQLQIRTLQNEIKKAGQVINTIRKNEEIMRTHPFNAIQGVVKMKQNEIDKLKNKSKIKVIKRKRS